MNLPLDGARLAVSPFFFQYLSYAKLTCLHVWTWHWHRPSHLTLCKTPNKRIFPKCRTFSLGCSLEQRRFTVATNLNAYICVSLCCGVNLLWFKCLMFILPAVHKNTPTSLYESWTCMTQTVDCTFCNDFPSSRCVKCCMFYVEVHVYVIKFQMRNESCALKVRRKMQMIPREWADESCNFSALFAC